MNTPSFPSPRSVGAGAVLTFAVLVLAAAAPLGAQVAPVAPSPDAATDQQAPVQLSPFMVSSTQTSQYGATEATSTTRIAEPIQDLSQSVSVVTSALMNDTGSFRIVDAASYLTPVGDPGAIEGGDRYSLRGFFISRRFIDGVTVSGEDGFNMASDETNIDRLEIIKGPNSILVPGGSPGGQINIVTKSPTFTDSTTLSYQYSQYLNSEASIDTDRVFGPGGNASIRLVASGWDLGSGYFTNYFKKGWLVAPSFSYRLGDRGIFTVKLESFYSKEAQLGGLPYDQGQGPNSGYLRAAPGFPLNFQFGGEDFYRERWETRLVAELDYKLTSVVNTRLWIMADSATRNDQGPGASYADPSYYSSNYNPLTGQYTPYTSFSYNAVTHTLTTTPVAPVTVYPRIDQENLIQFSEFHFKNDYVTELEPVKGLKSTTVTGIAANYSRVYWNNWTATNPVAVDLNNFEATSTYNPSSTVSTLGIDTTGAQTDAQIFAYEQLSAVDNRVIATAGVSRFWGELQRLDSGDLPRTAGVDPYSIEDATTDTNFGLVVKPIKSISIFAGYNRVGGGLPSSITAGQNPANFVSQEGDQFEAGVKGTLLDGRLTFSAAYFDIKQNNFATPNPEFLFNSSVPTFLYYDAVSKGEEFEAVALITKAFNILGNVSHDEARTTYGIPFFGPDNIGALFARYTFQDGVLRALNLTLGGKYASKTPVNFESGLTAAGVPYQPRGYLAPTTILQAGVGYTWRKWSARVIVDNLTNKTYLTTFGPALPRSVVGQLSKQF